MTQNLSLSVNCNTHVEDLCQFHIANHQREACPDLGNIYCLGYEDLLSLSLLLFEVAKVQSTMVGIYHHKVQVQYAYCDQFSVPVKEH